MIIDVIILSYATNADIVKMNNACIDSIINSSDIHTFNIILVETSSSEFKYSQPITLVQPNVEFGYNKYLNIGISYCKNDWILISNNDVLYDEHFIEYMMKAHEKDNQLLSMSCIDDHWIFQHNFNRKIPVHYGNRLKYELVGSSLLIHKKVLETIGPFDENYTFWYQDDDYVCNLNKYNIKHALISGSRVHHLTSKSNTLVKDWHNMVVTSEQYFRNKWKK